MALSNSPHDRPPLPPSLQRGADRLAASLAARNRAVYRRALSAHAAALGAKPPRHVQSHSVKEAIRARAEVSAQSLVRTHLAARQRFYEQTGDVGQAKALYKAWTEQRAGVVAQFEAGMAAHAAAADFRSRNADVLRGRAHVEPAETDSSDVCAELIAAGEVDLAEATEALPGHMHCPHVWVLAYEPPDEAGALWVGGPDDAHTEEDDA